MKTFRVRWEIDVESNSFVDAAKTALEVQRDNSSIATVFDVKDLKTKKVKRIDLENYEPSIDLKKVAGGTI